MNYANRHQNVEEENININHNPSGMVSFWQAMTPALPRLSLIFGIPLAAVLLAIFLTYVFSDRAGFAAATPRLMFFLYIFLGILAFFFLLNLGVRVIVRNLLQGIAETKRMFAIAQRESNFTEALLAGDHGYLALNEAGLVEGHALPAQEQVKQVYNYRGDMGGGEPYQEADDPEEDVFTDEKEGDQTIPDMVKYEDILAYIPSDHTLVGVGEGYLVDTTEKEAKGLIWVPGGSGAGKSQTVKLRVDEDYKRGHVFLGVDPHRFKEDSLVNLVQPYLDKFIVPELAKDAWYTRRKMPDEFRPDSVVFDMPLAFRDEEILLVLNYYLTEFERRRMGGRCYPLTLVIDEIGNLTSRPKDELTPVQLEIKVKIKEVARISGQETRGFLMNCIMISQDCTGLFWLRNRALMVFAHKMMMMSERLLACNQDMQIAKDMGMWPIGRTAVYGIALKGMRIRQQPLFDREERKSGLTTLKTPGLWTPPSVSRPETVETDAETPLETDSEADGEDNELEPFPFPGRGAAPLKKESLGVSLETEKQIRIMLGKNYPLRDIAYIVVMTGRRYTVFKQVVESIQREEEGGQQEAE